jgi:tetratricopeptide (TPR) repeat protein
MDQMPRALEILSNAQKYLPDEARLPFLAGNMYAHQENHEQAERAFAEARAKNSRDSGAALYHGIELLALERAEEAEAALSRAIDLAKDKNAGDAERAVYEMFSWHFGNDEYQKAYAWGKKHLGLVKKRDKLYRTLGIAAYLSDHYDDAGKWLGETIAKGAENAISLALYGQIHVSEGKFAEAETLFKRSLKHEETVQVLAQLGNLYLEKLNSPAQAITMLERAIELQPVHYLARYQLALAYRAAGRDAKTELDAWLSYLAVVKLISLEELGAKEKEYVEKARARIRELDAIIDP